MTTSMVTLSAASEHTLPQAIDVSFLRLVFSSLRSDGVTGSECRGSDAVAHLPSPAEFVNIVTPPPRIPLPPAAALLFSPLSTYPNHASFQICCSTTYRSSVRCFVSPCLLYRLLYIHISLRFAGTGVRPFSLKKSLVGPFALSVPPS